MLCGWEGNHRSGIALAMNDRLQWSNHLQVEGLWKQAECMVQWSMEVTCSSHTCFCLSAMTWCIEYISPLLQYTTYLRCDPCLNDKKGDHQNYSVLYCVQQLCTVICSHIRAVLKVDCWFGFTLALGLFSVCFAIIIPAYGSMGDT